MVKSDGDLEADSWKDALSAVKLRMKIKEALLRPAMVAFWETAPTGAVPPSMHNIVDTIFTDLDEDGNGELDYAELKLGLEKHDVIISSDEFRLLVGLVDAGHKGDLTAEMFTTFMEASESELNALQTSNDAEERKLDQKLKQKHKVTDKEMAALNDCAAPMLVTKPDDMSPRFYREGEFEGGQPSDVEFENPVTGDPDTPAMVIGS